MLAIFTLASCAQTSVTPISRNQLIVNASGAPACSGTAVRKIAADQAAVETIRRGFEGFIVVGLENENNVTVARTGFTTANTVYSGNNSTTTLGGQKTIVAGTHDSAIGIVMLNSGDEGFENALNARQILGEKWQEKVQKKVTNCL